MNVQKKVKFIITLAILLVITLSIVVTIQIVNISKANKKIMRQQEQIQQLENQLDYYDKTPDSDYEEIT